MRTFVATIAALFAVAGCSHSPPPPKHPEAPIITTTEWAPPPPHKPMTGFGDGRYEVGVDIVPGKYKTPGGTGPDKCYWARLKDLNGLVTSAIATGYDERGPDIVTIDPKDKGFETHACGYWRLQK